MSRARRKPSARVARYLAPAAFLLGVTIAVLLVRSGLGGGGTSTQTTTVGPVTRTATTLAQTTTRRGSGSAREFYTVQSGDTFGSVAAKVQISVEELQALNPGVSSNSLQVGQRLRVK